MKLHLIQAKGLLIAAVLIAVLAAVDGFRPIDELSWALRNKLFSSEASGQVALIQVEGRTDQIRTERLATVIEALSTARPSHVLLAVNSQVVDILLNKPETRERMNAFGRKLVVPMANNEAADEQSIKVHNSGIPQATIALNIDQTARTSPFGILWQYSYGSFVNSEFTPSQAAAGTDLQTQSDKSFLVDYSYRMSSFPSFLVSENRASSLRYQGLSQKTVIIAFGGSDEALKGGLPGFNYAAPESMLHAYAAETLIQAVPIHFGYYLPLAASLLFLIFSKALGLRRRLFALSWTAGLVICAGMPWVGGIWHYNFDVIPALSLLIVGLSLQMRQDWKDRIKQTSSSGAPSFDAFGSQTITAGGSVVVARVGTWTDIQTAIGISHQTELARQIMRRLQGADEDLALHHNGAESFCWRLPDNGTAISEHLLGLRALFEVPLTVAGKEVDVNLAFGVASLHTDETDARHRLAGAQSAALEAEQLGIISRTFDSGKMAEYEWNLALHTNIDKAIANGEIWVAYQPKLDLISNQITGAEALVRWTHPTRGNIPPSEFILHVERSGRMDALTRRVIRDAALSAAKMHALDRNFGVAINLSPALFEKPDLFAWLVDILSERPIRPESITWEVTETREVRDLAAAKPVLDRLKAAGFRISLDDFGTGAANMQVLSQLPFDEIKIDQRFIGKMASSSIDRAIVEAAIALGKSAGITVVAEGVEDHQTLVMLREMGCDMAQGFLIARPDKLERLIRQQSSGSLLRYKFG